jgi:hypothetical protein
MNHPNDDECGFRGLVVDHIIPVEMRPEAGGKVVTVEPEFRMTAQRLELLLDAPDERARRFRGVFGDERPDFGKIVLGLAGYAEGERRDCFCCSFAMIRSASKFCTRPASISSRPA